MKKIRMTVNLICLAAVLFAVNFAGLAYAEGEEIFSQPYDVSKVGQYIGSICPVNVDGTLSIPPDVSKIITDNPGGNIVVIQKGNYSYSIQVSDEGLRQLQDLSKNIYDKQSIRIKVRDMGGQVNVQADTARAGGMLSGLVPLVSIIVGVLAYMVIIGMGLFTAIDILYITMPVFRNKVDELKQAGSSLAVKYDKTGEAKLRWVTDEAVYAVSVCSVDSGKNPLGIYLQKRIWAYIMVAIVIYILLTGNVQLFVNIAINMVSGILDVLSNLGR